MSPSRSGPVSTLKASRIKEAPLSFRVNSPAARTAFSSTANAERTASASSSSALAFELLTIARQLFSRNGRMQQKPRKIRCRKKPRRVLTASNGLAAVSQESPSVSAVLPGVGSIHPTFSANTHARFISVST
jgi:hypothetical protein